MTGLLPEHHVELNKTRVKKERFDELRLEYENDNKALQQIDVYDPDTKYYDRIKQYREALKSEDDHLESVLERWFKIFYEDI